MGGVIICARLKKFSGANETAVLGKNIYSNPAKWVVYLWPLKGHSRSMEQLKWERGHVAYTFVTYCIVPHLPLAPSCGLWRSTKIISLSDLRKCS